MSVPTAAVSRRQEIARLAAATGVANVEELARRFSVTPSTIRRDLARLTSEGSVARTYGGAIALVAHPEASLRQRAAEAFEAKRAIARWAAAQVLPGESVLLDAGTTVGALAHELRAVADLTVGTISMTVLQELADVASVRVECLGGTLRRISQGFVGPLAEGALERMSFDRAFLGADGVSADRGICEAVLEQTHLKELMARRAERVYVLTHAAKVGRSDFHAWARLPRGWAMVTDESIDPAALVPFLDRGIEVVVVDSRGRRVNAGS